MTMTLTESDLLATELAQATETNYEFDLFQWVNATRRPKQATANASLRVVDLFSGCGGLSLGAEMAANDSGRPIDIRLAVDSDSDAMSVYRENFNVLPRNCACRDISSIFDGAIGDCTTTTEVSILADVGHLHLLIAGPPCQGHSNLNNKSRRCDPRNELYFRVIRAIEILSPDMFVIENVPSIIHSSENVINIAKEHFANMGYNTAEKVVNCFDIGLPQRRKRHVLVGKRVGRIPTFDTVRFAKKTVVGDVLIGVEEMTTSVSPFYSRSNMSSDNVRRVKYLFDNDLFDLPDEMRPACHNGKMHSYVSAYGRLHLESAAQTITSGFTSMGQGRYIHPTRARTITPFEAARLQGFPQFFKFASAEKRTSLTRMIGNAVPPPLGFFIIKRLLES